MQKVLYSLLVIGIVSSIVVGSGAIAYFNDTEISTGNTLTAGTLDLKVNGKDTNETTTVTTIFVSDIAPGDSGSRSTTLKNAGSISGELDIAMSDISETAGDSGEHAGGKDLDDNLKMALWLDVGGTAGTFDNGDIVLYNNNNHQIYDGTNVLHYFTANTYAGDYWDAVRTMVKNEEDNFFISWKIPTDVGNKIQGDSMSFNVTFTLEQADADKT